MKRLFRVLAVVVLSTVAFAQSGEVVPNENLVAEGIPKIPAALAESVGRYSEFRAAAFSGWHPGRREMLIETRFGDTYQVHLVKSPGAARTQLTFFPDRVAGAIYEPVKGDSFLFGKDVGGGEFFQLYRYDLATGNVTLLTDGKSRNTDPRWSYQGDRVAYGSTQRTGNDLDIWVVHPNDPASARLVSEMQGGGWSVSDWSPDGKQLVVINSVSAAEAYVWLIDVASGKKELLTPKTGADTVAYSNARFSKDGKGVYLTSDQDSEFQRLVYLDLASRQTTVLTPALNWDVDEFDLSNDGRWIAFESNEDGISVLHVLDTKSKKEVPTPKLPVGVFYDVHWRNNSRELAFSLTTASQPYDVYSVDMATGKLERWTFSETGGLNTSGFAEPQLIHWKSWDNRSISGFLYKPTKSAGKHPVIIDIHGGPEGQVRPEFLEHDNYYINELGVAMIYPNVRGSTGYGKTFQKLDNGFLREGSYKDINSLLDWIQTQPDLDAGKVMITGGSYGGFMTLAVATTYNDRICCSVDVVGPSNLVTFLEHTSGYRQDLRRVEYGDERDPKMREFLESIAPANKAKNITKPLFVIAGKNDPRVPASESAQMVDVVRKNGTPVWWLLGKDEGHGFAKKKNQDFQFYATVVFIKEYLLK
jgi:dipeptidyl aminopeptidase/acylaminoacyl peptidase